MSSDPSAVTVVRTTLAASGCLAFQSSLPPHLQMSLSLSRKRKRKRKRLPPALIRMMAQIPKFSTE
jgi:hypothetical protein